MNAPYFNGAKLLIAADCTAYAYANVHEDFMKGKVTLIGCPMLDSVDYSEKLMEIIRNNDIKSVAILRMEVPCCGGLEMAAKKALQESGKFIPIFSFDKGEEISTHAAGGDAMVTVLEGTGRFNVGDEVFFLNEGETLIMPNDIPHAVYGEEKFKMQLTVSF